MQATLKRARVRLAGERIKPEHVTIIVLNWNRAEETLLCLESLAQADLGGASVLVVDNGSADGSVERIRTRFPEQVILPLPQNHGYAGGNNAGIRVALDAGARAVLLLNNDTRVAPDFLAPMLSTLNADRKVAAVSGAILRMDNPEVLDVAFLDLYFGHGIIRQRGVNKLPGEGFDFCREVDIAVGCCLLLRAEAIREVGALDESYFAYHEEVDWCFRSRKAGYKIYYQPLARVWHGGSKSTHALGVTVQTDRTVVTGPQLANPIPLSWSPVRAYLGARNSVRFIRQHANTAKKSYFIASSLYNVPLELLAAVLRMEDALKIGAWSYRRALFMICFGERGRDPVAHRPLLERLVRAPIRLLWDFPREIWCAHREGRTAQFLELLRGLWDGLRDRPLPLVRLKLRGQATARVLRGHDSGEELIVLPSQVTIIVLNWNRADETIACLQSLSEADLGGATVLVVDNGSSDDSVERIQACFPRQRILTLPENRGYAGGNNAGIRAALDAGAKAVLLLNNDTRVAADFLVPLLETLVSDPNTGAVSSAIMRMDRPEMLDVAFSEVCFSRRECVRIQGVNALPGEGFDRRRRVDVAIGCSLLLTADALCHVGLFDERYFAYHEDVDWCLRAREVGFSIYYEPYSRVYHAGSRSTAGAGRPLSELAADADALPNAEPLPWNPVRTYLGARNTFRLLRRHASWRQKLAFLRSTVQELPLAFFAVVEGREGVLRLGRWSYRDFIRQHFSERHRPPTIAQPGRGYTAARALRLLITIPVDLFVMLPLEVYRSHRDGRMDEYYAYLRGLRDGLLGRPIPLERLRLR